MPSFYKNFLEIIETPVLIGNETCDYIMVGKVGSECFNDDWSLLSLAPPPQVGMIKNS